MSFGKDNQRLNSIPSNGQATFDQLGAVTNRRKSGDGPRRGGGGGSFYWADNFELSTSPQHPDRFRLLRGQYKVQEEDSDGGVVEHELPYLRFREHYHGGVKRGVICAAGPHYMDPKRREPCGGCDLFWEDHEEGKRQKALGNNSFKKRVSMQDKYVFSVFDYAYYFEMPQPDGKGGFRMNNRTNQPYTSWEKAVNTNDPKYGGRPWRQGDARPWVVNDGFKQTLMNINVAVGTHCLGCSGANTIYSHGWFCSNTQCSAPVFDPNNTSLTPDQQMELIRNPQRCNTCGQVGFIREYVGCRNNCQAPTRASVFDVDLFGFVQKGNSGAQNQLIITSWSLPGAPQLNDPNDLARVVPLDLHKKFAPFSNKKILDDFKIQEKSPMQQAQGVPQGYYQPPHAPPVAGYPPAPGVHYQPPHAVPHTAPQAYPQTVPQPQPYDPNSQYHFNGYQPPPGSNQGS